MSIDVFRELPALDDHLQALAESSRGRMARVVSADGHMVTVEVPRKGGWDGPLGPYPATVTGLVAGDIGVLVPLRGNAFLFVVVGATIAGLIDIRHHGAVSGFDHDDTSAFEAAWRKAIAERKGLYVPPGDWIYTGAGLTGHTYPTIVGAGMGVSSINLGSTSYLLKPAEATTTLLLRDVGVYGGYGAIQHTYTGTNVRHMHVVESCYFSDYTRACIETNSSDFPYWKVKTSQFSGKDTLLTMGVALSGLTDQDSIIDCSFIRNRVHVKLEGGGDNAEILNCDFIRFSETRTNGPCIDVWVTPQATETNAGAGFVLRDSKFGNEGLMAGDYRIVVAEQGTGVTFGQRWPLLTTASTGHWVGAAIQANHWAARDGAQDVPFVFTTTPNLGGVHIGPILANSSLGQATIVQFQGVPHTPLRHNGANTVGPMLGYRTGIEPSPAPKVSNVPGWFTLIDPNGILATNPQYARLGPGTPANYKALLTAGINAFTKGAAVTRSATTDALGGPDAAALTLPPNDPVFAAIGLMTPQVPVWVEVDVAGPLSGTALGKLQVYIRDQGSGDYHFMRTVAVPTASPWHTYRFSFVARTAGAPANVILLNPEAASASVRVGRVRVYHATEPVPGGLIVPANPNTSGANLAALEAEINELKQAMRDLGLMAT